MKKNLTIALSLFAAAAIAQPIVIDQSDFPTVGTSFYMGIDEAVTLGTSVGTASPNAQTWDFSILETDSLTTIEFLDPTAVPYGDLFPTSDIAFNQSGGFAFADFATGNVDVIGISIDFGGGVGPLDISMGVVAQNPWTIFEFPATLGTAFEDTAMFETTFNSVGLIPSPINLFFNPDSIRFKRTTYSDVVIDAYGSLTDALGNTHQVLRMNFHEISIDTAWGYTGGSWSLAPNLPGTFDNPSLSDTRKMRFLSETMGYIVAEIDVDLVTGQPVSALFLSDPSECCTGVEELIQAGNMLVFPNPANDVVKVRTGGDNLVMNITDLSGRVHLRSNITVDGASVDVSTLATGAYIYQLIKTDGSLVKIGKLIKN